MVLSRASGLTSGDGTHFPDLRRWPSKSSAPRTSRASSRHSKAAPTPSTADPLINSNRLRINTLAIGARLPTIYNFRDSVEAAGLMSYGPNLVHLFRRVADYVDKIFRGAKAADIPVEQPTKFDLVLNLIIAQALGLTMPPTLLARADEVIE